ncbi:MAG: citramalate synthase [Alphaproteobacteria bacterium]|nr:citramalate synthase [Alphaproteobacteria bacterium]
MARRLTILDTTLRDGAQTRGVEFSVADKIAISEALDRLGVDYIEGGWPGSNPVDNELFANPPKLRNSRMVAFGMTRRAGISAANDPGMAVLVQSDTSMCIVGKSWDFHVEKVLQISLEENLDLIATSIVYLAASGREVLFDAEHFFDGYRANPDYALRCVEAALNAGARWVVLCDTNGGGVPNLIADTVYAVAERFDGGHLGIHTHNDTGNAVANTLMAVEAGACHVQGTLNGLGERCGNADILTTIANLAFKTDFDIGAAAESLHLLRPTAKLLDERLARESNSQQPYVGDSAFAHKAGLHASAMARDTRSYEHIAPELVGNVRHIVVSEQSGRANLVDQLSSLGYHDVAEDTLRLLLKRLKEEEAKGFSFDGSMASFHLLVGEIIDHRPDFFNLMRYSVAATRRRDRFGEIFTETEVTVQVMMPNGTEVHRVAMGNGPVNAMDLAMKSALCHFYPILQGVNLLDYKVRIMPARDDASGTAAMTRVRIESALGDAPSAITQGVSTNVLDASYFAMRDTYRHILWKEYRRDPGKFDLVHATKS